MATLPPEVTSAGLYVRPPEGTPPNQFDLVSHTPRQMDMLVLQEPGIKRLFDKRFAPVQMSDSRFRELATEVFGSKEQDGTRETIVAYDKKTRELVGFLVYDKISENDQAEGQKFWESLSVSPDPNLPDADAERTRLRRESPDHFPAMGARVIHIASLDGPKGLDARRELVEALGRKDMVLILALVGDPEEAALFSEALSKVGDRVFVNYSDITSEEAAEYSDRARALRNAFINFFGLDWKESEKVVYVKPDLFPNAPGYSRPSDRMKRIFGRLAEARKRVNANEKGVKLPLIAAKSDAFGIKGIKDFTPPNF